MSSWKRQLADGVHLARFAQTAGAQTLSGLIPQLAGTATSADTSGNMTHMGTVLIRAVPILSLPEPEPLLSISRARIRTPFYLICSISSILKPDGDTISRAFALSRFTSSIPGAF